MVLFGQGISSFGDAISNTAMPILVLALTGSGFAMGIVGVLSTLPDLLVGLPAGAYADRWDRRKMMLGRRPRAGRAHRARARSRSGSAGRRSRSSSLVAFPINVLRVLWLAAYTAAVPGLVGRDQVPRANGIFEAVFNVGWIVGPALAGLLAGAIGPGPDDRHRRRSRSSCRPCRCCSSGGRCGRSGGRSRRTSSPTSARGSGSSPGSPRCAR